MTAGAYIEGYVGTGVVTRSNGSRVFEIEVPYKRSLVREIDPGRYRLDFSVRPCDANCGHLDAVVMRCSTSLLVVAGQTTDVHIVVRPVKGCDITLG
jgi:hypothetical protein